MINEEQKSLAWLISILDILRVECPWDKAQTTDSLRYLSIEEVYELSEAILASNSDEQCKELGDLFMHILFYSKIAEDEGRFALTDVIDGVCRKLISRHPHISLPSRDGVLQPAVQTDQPQWEKVKMKEGRRSVLEGVPPSLPPLVKAVRMQEKVAGIGFRWPNAEAALAKVDEEYSELQQALFSHEGKARAEEEFGDLLLALVCYGNALGLNADDALAKANQKFQNRFLHVESQARSEGRALSEMTLEELMALWREAKRKTCAD